MPDWPGPGEEERAICRYFMIIIFNWVWAGTHADCPHTSHFWRAEARGGELVSVTA